MDERGRNHSPMIGLPEHNRQAVRAALRHDHDLLSTTPPHLRSETQYRIRIMERLLGNGSVNPSELGQQLREKSAANYDPGAFLRATDIVRGLAQGGGVHIPVPRRVARGR